jgi:hypothetical protein
MFFFFFFQIERCNYFLTNMVKATQVGHPVDGRLVSFLLHVSVMLLLSCVQSSVVLCVPVATQLFHMDYDVTLTFCSSMHDKILQQRIGLIFQ